MLLYISEVISGKCRLSVGLETINIFDCQKRDSQTTFTYSQTSFMTIIKWFISPCVIMSPVLLVAICSSNFEQSLFLTSVIIFFQDEAAKVLIKNKCL